MWGVVREGKGGTAFSCCLPRSLTAWIGVAFRGVGPVVSAVDFSSRSGRALAGVARRECSDCWPTDCYILKLRSAELLAAGAAWTYHPELGSPRRGQPQKSSDCQPAAYNTLKPRSPVGKRRFGTSKPRSVFDRPDERACTSGRPKRRLRKFMAPTTGEQWRRTDCTLCLPPQ